MSPIEGYARGDPDEVFNGSGFGMADAWRSAIDHIMKEGF